MVAVRTKGIDADTECVDVVRPDVSRQEHLEHASAKDEGYDSDTDPGYGGEEPDEHDEEENAEPGGGRGGGGRGRGGRGRGGGGPGRRPGRPGGGGGGRGGGARGRG